MSAQEYELITTVVLVHGTFAREAAWTAEDSDLRRIFRETLGSKTSFEIFNWSGGNSHLERSKAAESLGASALTKS